MVIILISFLTQKLPHAELFFSLSKLLSTRSKKVKSH